MVKLSFKIPEFLVVEADSSLKDLHKELTLIKDSKVNQRLKDLQRLRTTAEEEFDSPAAALLWHLLVWSAAEETLLTLSITCISLRMFDFSSSVKIIAEFCESKAYFKFFMRFILKHVYSKTILNFQTNFRLILCCLNDKATYMLESICQLFRLCCELLLAQSNNSLCRLSPKIRSYFLYRLTSLLCVLRSPLNFCNFWGWCDRRTYKINKQ